MKPIEHIEDAIRKLTQEERAAFRSWFLAFDAADWDRQLAEDVEAGRLSQLAQEAINELRDGRCTDR